MTLSKERKNRGKFWISSLTKTPRKRAPGRPPRGEEDSARKQITHAALLCFARAGFQATTIDTIAETANVARPLLRYHFSSKEDLWKAAVAYGFESYINETAKFAVEAQKGETDDLLLMFARAIVRASAHRPHIHHIALDEMRLGGQRAEWIKKTYMTPMSKALVAGFMSTGLVKGPASDGSMMAHLIPALHGAMCFPFLDPGTVQSTFGVDCTSDAYVEQHAEFTAQLLKSSLQIALGNDA